jgi:hypothetical protein
MREESCRRCGQEMDIGKKCDICNKPNQYHCHRCGYEPEKQIHSTCMMVDSKARLLN